MSRRYRVSADWRPRTIQIVCQAASHEEHPQFVGVLTSQKWVMQERWFPTEQTDRQTLSTKRATVTPQQAQALTLAGQVATRHRFACDICGDDVVAGDRLDGRPGWSTLLETPPGEAWRDDKAARTDAALSELANAGVPQLSLAGLRSILSW